MKMHGDLSTGAFAFDPVAEHIGPFAGPDFLAAWQANLGHTASIEIAETSSALAAFVRGPDHVEFAGDPDVTDYHSPRGEGAARLIAEFLGSLQRGTRIRFDSLPAEAARVVAEGVSLAGITADQAEHEVTQVIALPPSYDEYVGDLSKKVRHEARRKRRRFEGGLGTPRVERRRGAAAVELFVAMHRMSPGEKGGFMDEARAAFFLDLHERAAGNVDVLTTSNGKPVAAAFSFEDASTYYLYNSAYDPAESDLSPGIVLLELLIRSAIHAGKSRFDLLKGAEPYKLRIGGRPRPLFVVSGTVGGQQ